MQNNSNFNPFQNQPLTAAQPTTPAATSAQPQQPTTSALSFNLTTPRPSMSASQFSPITTQPTAQSTQSSPIQQRAFQPSQPLPTQFQPTAPQSQSFNTAQPAQPVRTAQANSVMSTATNVATTQLNQATQFNPISSAAPTATAVTSAQSTATTSPFNPLTAQPAAPAAASFQPTAPLATSFQPTTSTQPTTSATSGYTGAGFAAIDPSVLTHKTTAGNSNNTNTTSTSAFSQLTTQAGNIIADRPTLPSQQFGASQVPQSRLPHYVTAVATPPNSFKNILCEALIPVSTSGYCTSRLTYILAATVQVVVIILLIILCIILAISGMGLLDLLVFPFTVIYPLVSLFMLMRRRLCDAGKPTWLRFLVFTPAAPVVCFIANFAPSIQWQDNVPRYLSFFSKK